MYEIKLHNRDGANLRLLSNDNHTWTFDVDEKHKYILEHCRVSCLSENDTNNFAFIDPSGGPFLHINYKIENTDYVIESICYKDNKFVIETR